MKFSIVLLLAFVALSVASLREEIDLFTEFQHTYGKSYSTEEFGKRFLNFRSNLQKAEALNKAGDATFGVTKFMDLSTEEFADMYLMPKREEPEMVNAPVADLLEPSVNAPTNFDWRSKNAITPVKNQEQCGSCWAFSATETIESYWFLQTKRTLPTLAPQQIVDCDRTSYGCNGGWTYSAFKYVIQAGGIDSEARYPYQARDGSCHSSTPWGASISAFNYVTRSEDENQMLEWTNSKGPLSVCVDAESWQTYTGGVITPSQCGHQVDHCVMVTGFSSQNGIAAWNVRNSWGTDWGVGGYLYVSRNSNTCSIATTVTAVTSKQ